MVSFEEDSTVLGFEGLAGHSEPEGWQGCSIHGEGETGMWRRKAAEFCVVTVTDGFAWPVISCLRSIAGRGKLYVCGRCALPRPMRPMTSLRIRDVCVGEFV